MDSGTTTNAKTNLSEKNRFHLGWVIPTILHPKRTIEEIVKKDKSVWLTPLVLISILVVIAGLVGGPIRKNAIISGATQSVDFQYLSTDQQTQFKNAQATQSSALFTFVFPIVESLLGLWFSWFILSSLLHLSLTLSGSRASTVH